MSGASGAPTVDDIIGHLLDGTSARTAEGFESLKHATRVGKALLDAFHEIQNREGGRFLLSVLRVFHAKRGGKDSDARKLANLYRYVCKRAGEVPPDADALAKAFAAGQVADAKARAAETYADALLRIDYWLGATDTGIDWGEDPTEAPWGARGKARKLARALETAVSLDEFTPESPDYGSTWKEIQAYDEVSDELARIALGDGNRWNRAKPGAE